MKPKFNLKDKFVKNKMQSIQFLDIETSLVDARVFRTGTQFIGAHQMSNHTKILTAAGGTMYDLYTKGEKGVWAFSNHMDKKRFKKDPLDDTFVLERLWDICDKADVIVAHNAQLGRFLQKGWKLPTKFSVVCTYKGLHNYAFTSKKLDSLSKQLIGERKISTDWSLWDRCSNGEVAAFEEMLEYNKGDITPTLFDVYMRTCAYYPDYCVDLSNYDSDKIQCKVDGKEVQKAGLWLNRKNGMMYTIYENPRLGITYRNRYNTESKKADLGLIRQHK
jgi:hypothetical protein